MPSDITGTELIDIDQNTGQRSFRFHKGPIFANLVSFGQFLIGVSIFTGTLTNISLLVAIFMNFSLHRFIYYMMQILSHLVNILLE